MSKKRKQIYRQEDSYDFLPWLAEHYGQTYLTVMALSSSNRTPGQCFELLVRHNDVARAAYMKWVLLDRPSAMDMMAEWAHIFKRINGRSS